jgi:hypothetical protein
MQVILTEDEYKALKQAAMPTIKIEQEVRDRCAKAMTEWLKSAIHIFMDERNRTHLCGPEALLDRLKTRAATLLHPDKGGGETEVKIFAK